MCSDPEDVDHSVNAPYDIAAMELGEFIRRRRAELGLSLRSTAHKLGISPAHLSRIERGRAKPSLRLLDRLAEVLGCNRDALLLLAGRLPDDIRAMIARRPNEAAAGLRSLAQMRAIEAENSRSEFVDGAQGQRAIEGAFPFEWVSEVAEVESWRKEIYRPIYHVHKWWAQRLGSVFRAAILGAALPSDSSLIEVFYSPIRLTNVVVFDPFMGSGTIVGEAHKLGCTVVGRDINPVAYRAVRAILGPLDHREVHEQFRWLESTVGKEIKWLYRSTDSDGRPCDVLYFFWVKVLDCPACGKRVDLFSRYVFATHAYNRRHPEARIICPECGAVLLGLHDATGITCSCGTRFNPQDGPAKRVTAVCRACGHEFSIARAAKSAGRPPDHRLYAKLVLREDGTKEYLPITHDDVLAFQAARDRLRALEPPVPKVRIPDGHNTRQILNYGYQYWHELFNDRQLLALTMLASAIRELPPGSAREVLAILFSGLLEFSNMFTTYKGEGTGAVRHMFSHHILKPERMPIEGNIWGTPKSSGSFSTLYKSRLLRALSYRQAPFEVRVERRGRRKMGRKVFGLSPAIGGCIADRYPQGGLAPGAVYLSCGDSSVMDLPTGSVDLVVTDPPFFDNVHYSELADVFFVWQQLYFFSESWKEPACWSTRSDAEVQDKDPQRFATKLSRVFAECHRVLRDEGLLVFSYHHSREPGWVAMASAVLHAGFSIVQSQPVRAEMASAAPKSRAREPIRIDVLVVCRKRAFDRRPRLSEGDALERACNEARDRVMRFNRVGQRLSRNDVRVILLSQLLVELSAQRTREELCCALEGLQPMIGSVVEDIWRDQRHGQRFSQRRPDSDRAELDLGL